MKSDLVFSQERVARYTGADLLCPNARDHERTSIMDALRKNLHPGARILEIGSGSGMLTREMLAVGYVVETVDPYFTAVQGVWAHSRFDCAQGLPLNPAQPFDAVVSIATMHHIATAPDFLTAALLKDLSRLTKIGGVLVLKDVPRRAAAELRSSETDARRAMRTAQFFETVVDVHSVPPHLAVYLDMRALAEKIGAEYGWDEIEIGFSECDWLFSDPAEARKYVQSLFNLDIGTSELEALTQDMIEKDAGGTCWRWALDFLVMRRV